MARPGPTARGTRRRVERRHATRGACVADLGSRGGDAGRFFDDPEYRGPAAPLDELHDSARQLGRD